MWETEDKNIEIRCIGGETVTVAAIIPAAGMGRRLGVGYNKQYIDLLDKPMVVRTIETISNNELISEVIWVVGDGEIEQARRLADEYKLLKVTNIIVGGKERIHSVINGFRVVSEQAEYLFIHDGARPLVTQEIIDRCIRQAMTTGAAIAAVPVKDTIKIVDNDEQLIQSTPIRSTLWAAQTPQIIKKKWFEEAIAELFSVDELSKVTDDSMLMEMTNRPVSISLGSYENIKVTTTEDVKLAELILKGRQ